MVGVGRKLDLSVCPHVIILDISDLNLMWSQIQSRSLFNLDLRGGLEFQNYKITAIHITKYQVDEIYVEFARLTASLPISL